MKITRNRSIVL